MAFVLLATIQTSGYINPYKVGGAVLLLLIWVKLLAWVDKDATIARLPREIVNSALFAGMLGGYFLFFLLPTPAAFGTLVGLFVLDIGGYIGARAKNVGLGDLKDELKGWWKGMFKKRHKELKAIAGQVTFIDKGGTPQEPPSDAESPEALQFQSAQKFMIKPLARGAERLDLVAADTPTIAHTVDGIRYDGEAMDRNAAAAAVQFFKRMGGLDLNERRKPQTGNFKLVAGGKRLPIQITSQGSTSGESVKILVDPKARHSLKIDALGLLEDQMAVIHKVIADDPGGLVILAAPKTQGLTTLAYAVLRAHDAFMEHIHTIERGTEMDLEGISQNALAPAANGAEEAKQVNWVVSQEPDIVMMTTIEDRNSAIDMIKFSANEKRRAYVCLRAGNTFEALALWRKLVGEDNLAMKSLKMIIAGRLVRRLCDACKVGYTPDPAQLRKMNMNPDSVGQLFSGRKEPLRDHKGNIVPCNFCHDLGFKGRFGVYEIFQIDDEIKKVVVTGGSDAQLKQAFRKQKGRLLQEVALSQVQAGETSVEEVLRVLKTEPPSGSSSSGRGAAPAPEPKTPQPKTRPATS